MSLSLTCWCSYRDKKARKEYEASASTNEERLAAISILDIIERTVGFRIRKRDMFRGFPVCTLDIILIHYQQTTNPAASPVKDNKIPSHTSTTQMPFAVIVPITPRTAKQSTSTQIKVISSPSSTSKTIGNPPSNLAILPGMTNNCAKMDEWNVKEIDADSTSNPAAASPVTVKKMPITPHTPKESKTEMLQDAVLESQSIRYENFEHQDCWKSIALLQETGVEKEDNDEEKSSDDDGEGSMVQEIVKNEDGNMVDREGTLVEVEDLHSLEAPYLEVCTTNASISILFDLL